MYSYKPDIYPDIYPDIIRTNRTNRTNRHQHNPDILGSYIYVVDICPVSGWWPNPFGVNS
jgi:hypothetical protein